VLRALNRKPGRTPNWNFFGGWKKKCEMERENKGGEREGRGRKEIGVTLRKVAS